MKINENSLDFIWTKYFTLV